MENEGTRGRSDREAMFSRKTICSPCSLLVSFLLALSSHVEGAGSDVSNAVALATFRGGEVLSRDVEREIMFLPQQERRYRSVERMSDARQWSDWMQRIALREISLQIAAETGLDQDPLVRERARRKAREWWLGRWKASCYGMPFEKPDDNRLRQELKGQEKAIPARLRLSHIFLRSRTPREEAAAVARLERLRAEIGSLESFWAIAAEVSESESARRSGKLGWLQKGWLPQEAEQVLLGLPEGSISPPIALRGGVHLFFVEKNEPATSRILDGQVRRLRGEKRTAMFRSCRQARLQEAEALPLEETAERLKVGSWEVPTEVLEVVYGSSEASLEETLRLLGEDERLFQLALELGAPSPEERRQLRSLESDVYLGIVAERRIQSLLRQPTSAELRAIFDGESNGFKTTLRLDLRVLQARIPSAVDPLEFFERLEELARRLRGGELEWSAIAPGTLGIEAIEDWPFLEALEIADRLSPVVFSSLAETRPGEVIGPIQNRANFYVVWVEGREEPRAKTFEEAKPQLVRRWRKQHRQDVGNRVVGQMLGLYDYRLTAEGQKRTRAFENHVEIDR